MKNAGSFFSFINSIESCYTISMDEYQRGYIWPSNNAINLLETIISAKHPVFIGNFIIQKDENNVFIVDGQQRLITIYIIMKALLDIMLKKHKYL